MAGGISAPGTPAGMTLTEIVITAVATVIVFVGVLVLVLELARRRASQVADEPGSFGSEGEEDDEGAPGYGRPAGYGPPPLWTDARYDPRR